MIYINYILYFYVIIDSYLASLVVFHGLITPWGKQQETAEGEPDGLRARHPKITTRSIQVSNNNMDWHLVVTFTINNNYYQRDSCLVVFFGIFSNLTTMILKETIKKCVCLLPKLFIFNSATLGKNKLSIVMLVS